jgi:hypothetical protein
MALLDLAPTESRPVALLLLSSTLAIAYIAAIVIYRLTLHPCAKYPGPWLAKVSALYAAYHAARADVHLDVQACHERYGATPPFRALLTV